jgi:ubiquinol-cytochrome c reductase cytochrome b subunit
MASFFFIILYSHFFKAFLYFRFRLKLVWFIGLLIFLFLILEAFLGYTLIWSQISFWAATVITSLIRVIPLIGLKIIVFI